MRLRLYHKASYMVLKTQKSMCKVVFRRKFYSIDMVNLHLNQNRIDLFWWKNWIKPSLIKIDLND